MPLKQAPTLPLLISLLKRTNFTRYTVIRYGYRQLRVVGDDVTDGPFEYTAGDEMSRLQHRLAAAAGQGHENHEVYEVVTPGGETLYLWFRDWRLTVGTATQPY